MITFNEMWNFIKTTYVTEDVLHIINTDGNKITTKEYIKYNAIEYRFDIPTLEKMWDNQYTFIVHATSINSEVRKLVEEIEFDNNVNAQAHIYAGKVGSKSFPVHADERDNLIIQCIGKSKVTIYNEYSDCDSTANITIKEQHILEPGNSIFVPSLQFHLFEPLTDRLSISIPMIKK